MKTSAKICYEELEFVDLCKGLRDYQLAVLQGLEDGDPAFEAVFLLDAASQMSEHSSEDEADSDE